MPAHRIDWVRKVSRFRPDGVILDLEDAVPADRRGEARALVTEEISILAEHGIVPIVRINSIDSEGATDVAAVVQPGLAGVMLPKAHSPQDVQTLDAWLAFAERAQGMAVGSIGILPLPETAQGMWFAHEIACASARVSGLITAVSGPVVGDVARAFGFQPTADGLEQLFLQSRIVLASRAAGALFPIGTLMGVPFDDLPAVERLARRARSLGFSGAALVHPSHVAIANRMFRPSAEEVSHAAGLVTALADANASGNAAVSYRGVMVDTAMLPHARETLAADARYRVLDARTTPQPEAKSPLHEQHSD